MFDLERTERYIVLVLAATLMLGIGAAVYVRSRPAPPVKVGHFNAERLPADTGGRRPAERARVNINEAGAEELMRLKGVGKVLAARIVEYRASHGLFVVVDDIKRVEGVGPALFKKIRDDIKVD